MIVTATATSTTATRTRSTATLSRNFGDLTHAESGYLPEVVGLGEEGDRQGGGDTASAYAVYGALHDDRVLAFDHQRCLQHFCP